MTNQQCRLIAAAIVILAGGVTLSLGLISRTKDFYDSDGESAGTIILLVGAIMFLRDYIKSLQDDEKN